MLVQGLFTRKPESLPSSIYIKKALHYSVLGRIEMEEAKSLKVIKLRPRFWTEEENLDYKVLVSLSTGEFTTFWASALDAWCCAGPLKDFVRGTGMPTPFLRSLHPDGVPTKRFQFETSMEIWNLAMKIEDGADVAGSVANTDLAALMRLMRFFSYYRILRCVQKVSAVLSEFLTLGSEVSPRIVPAACIGLLRLGTIPHFILARSFVVNVITRWNMKLINDMNLSASQLQIFLKYAFCTSAPGCPAYYETYEIYCLVLFHRVTKGLDPTVLNDRMGGNYLINTASAKKHIQKHWFANMLLDKSRFDIKMQEDLAKLVDVGSMHAMAAQDSWEETRLGSNHLHFSAVKKTVLYRYYATVDSSDQDDSDADTVVDEDQVDLKPPAQIKS